MTAVTKSVSRSPMCVKRENEGHHKNNQKQKLDMKVNNIKGLYNVCECCWENTKKHSRGPDNNTPTEIATCT